MSVRATEHAPYIDIEAVEDRLTHYVDEDDPDGPTWCGLDSRLMPFTDGEVDCPMCVMEDEA